MKEHLDAPQTYSPFTKTRLEKKWVAVYTRSRYEKRVADDLSQRGIMAYLPLVKTLRQWSDRKRWVDVPLFNSYVFVYIEPENHRTIFDTPGAVYVVKFEGRPAIISESQIASLQALLSSSLNFEVSCESFDFGQRVEIIQGPLMGQKGSVVEHKGKKRVMMRIDAIGQSLLIDILAAKLRKLPVGEAVAISS